MSNTHETTNPDAYGRLDVTIGEASFQAGKQSPVTILLRNPFDVPVEVMEIRGPRSYNLKEIELLGSPPPTERAHAADTEPSSKPGFWKNLVQRLGRVRLAEVSFGGVTAHLPGSEKTLNIKAEMNSDVELAPDVSAYETINLEAKEGAKVRFTPKMQQDKPEAETPKKAFTIEPHCEAVAYFVISTTAWLFFTPIRQSLSTQVRYRINGKEKTQVTSSDFEVKPPLEAMVIGSISGAVLGSLAKVLNSTVPFSWSSTAVSVGGSVVMSLIAAIALARKTGTQGFITVEDFFGGFVVGALIGYGGSSYFEKAIVPPHSAAPPAGG
jgi:hypothetical protein